MDGNAILALALSLALSASTSRLLSCLEMTSMTSQDQRPYSPSTNHPIHMHPNVNVDPWDKLSQPGVLVTIVAILLTCVYKYAQHRAALDDRPLPTLLDLLWYTVVFVIPAFVLYAIDRWLNPPLFPIPMLQPQPTTHAAKSEVLRRILRFDQPGGIVASVSQAGIRAYSNTFSSYRGDTTKPAGLVNWDNSCFQNSILQGLASLRHLPRYLTALTPGQSLPVGHDDTSIAASALRAFVADLNNPENNGKTLFPPGILRNMNTIQQQDAQEYYSKLVDQVEEDVEKSAKAACKPPGFESELTRDDTVTSQHSDDSGYQSLPMLSKAGSELVTIRNPLVGLSAQRVACTACGYSEGLSMLPFNCLTLDFEVGVSHYDIFELLDNSVRLEFLSNVNCDKCTLLEYGKRLQQMAKVVPAAVERLQLVEQMLEEDEFDDESLKKLKIPDSAKVSSTKTKQVAIGRPPPSLVMHMNRSVFDRTTGHIYKNLAGVQFPKTLDIGPWCIGSAGGKDVPSEADAEIDSGESQPPENVRDKEQWVLDATASMVAGDTHPSKISGPIYELRAVVTHAGRHDNGHYVCFRKHPRGSAKALKHSKIEGNDELPDDVDSNDGDPVDRTTAPTADPEGPYGEDRDSEWWRLSDENVYQVSEQNVLSQGGVFMLFYDCIDPNSILITAGDTPEAKNPVDENIGSSFVEEESRGSSLFSDDSAATLCNNQTDREDGSEVSSVTMASEEECAHVKSADSVTGVTTVTEVSEEMNEAADKDVDDQSRSRASSVTMTAEETQEAQDVPWMAGAKVGLGGNTASLADK